MSDAAVASSRRGAPRLLIAAGIALVAILVFAPRAGTSLVVSSPLTAPDAIVSLASHEWERLPATAALAAQYPRALVVLTVPQHVNSFNCHDCAHRPERLMAAGVQTGRVRFVQLTQTGTYGEAIATKTFVETNGFKRILVVTSPYHTRRSLMTFRTVLKADGVTVGVAPSSATSPARPARWWATPYDRSYMRYEWAAIAYYAIRYGVPPWT